MRTIFANSSIGTDFTNLPTDANRTGLGCATAAQLAACHFVRTDGIAFVNDSGLKFGLAHVRVESQIEDLDKLKKYVNASQDVYLIGGFAPQFGPALAIVRHYSLLGGLGVAKGVNRIYAHVRKPESYLRGMTDDTGHVTGFVALVGPNAYSIGTHSLLGCVGVLVVPQNTVVTIHKIHIYDATHTLGNIGAYNTAGLTTQLLV